METLLDDLLFICTSDSIDREQLVEIYNRESKHHILSTMNDLFCKYYICKNVWLVRYFHQSLKNIEECRNKEHGMEHWIRLTKILQQLGTRKTDLTKLPIDSDLIQRISYLHTADFEMLLPWKHRLKDEVFAQVNYVYKNLYTAENVSLCLQCILHLNTLKNNDIFTEKTEYHIMDILWKMLSNVAKESTPLVGEFYILCRDLYYYKLKLKSRPDRLNYLLFCVLVLCKRDVHETVIDVGGLEKTLPATPPPNAKTSKKQSSSVCKNMDYLYVTVPYDEEMMKSIEREKMWKKQQERQKKGVVVDKMPVYVEKQNVQVTKIIR